MYDKAGETYPSTIEYVTERFETGEMCDRVIFGNLLSIRHVLDQ